MDQSVIEKCLVPACETAAKTVFQRQLISPYYNIPGQMTIDEYLQRDSE